MILSNVEIHKALDEGRLRIDPEPTPRFPSLAQPQCPYDTTSVNLRLGSRISIPKEGAYIFDLRKGGIAPFLTDNSDHLEIDARTRVSFEGKRLLPGVERLLCLPGVATLREGVAVAC